LDSAATFQISPMDLRIPKFKPKKCWNPDSLSSPEERMATWMMELKTKTQQKKGLWSVTDVDSDPSLDRLVAALRTLAVCSCGSVEGHNVLGAVEQKMWFV